MSKQLSLLISDHQLLKGKSRSSKGTDLFSYKLGMVQAPRLGHTAVRLMVQSFKKTILELKTGQRNRTSMSRCPLLSKWGELTSPRLQRWSLAKYSSSMLTRSFTRHAGYARVNIYHQHVIVINWKATKRTAQIGKRTHECGRWTCIEKKKTIVPMLGGRCVWIRSREVLRANLRCPMTPHEAIKRKQCLPTNLAIVGVKADIKRNCALTRLHQIAGQTWNPDSNSVANGIASTGSSSDRTRMIGLSDLSLPKYGATRALRWCCSKLPGRMHRCLDAS